MGIVDWLRDSKNRDVACVAGGMAGVLFGRKVIGPALFAKGIHGLERRWREEQDFDGTFAERWKRAVEFYEYTHQDPMNRTLHIIGIPMIVGGAAGLLVFPAYRPLWLGSASWFAAGWVLNIIGHGVFEKNAPAFADDPLSFVAGPVWDLDQLKAKIGLGEPEPLSGPAAQPTGGNGHGAPVEAVGHGRA